MKVKINVAKPNPTIENPIMINMLMIFYAYEYYSGFTLVY